MERCTRRAFIQGVAALGLCAGCGSGGAGAATDAGPVAFDVPAGTLADLPVGSLRAVAGAQAIVGRDAGGVYAMSSVCPHASCDMRTQGRVGASGVFCDCHGSSFDANGAVVGGPARTPLGHYAASVDAAGNITVHLAQLVAATARTPAP